MPKQLLLLAALTLLCCLISTHGFPMYGCKCIRTTSKFVPLRAIMKLEMRPISGHCRWVEFIIITKNGYKICIDPSAKWLSSTIRRLQMREGATTLSPTTAA
ncbi:interleukin-8 [Echeneis naucrates]|uniref:Chemokine interleukin-8-like domain-containing protein n=1 Tax=Echeneis naucrates TaxID=173247 RepID=A0A665WEK4_ECHNA|nr:C-X-C motif chemokine 13 [Echeneis naucrates]